MTSKVSSPRLEREQRGSRLKPDSFWLLAIDCILCRLVAFSDSGRIVAFQSAAAAMLPQAGLWASRISLCSALRAFEERRLAEGPKEEFRCPWLSLQCNGNIHFLCDGDSKKDASCGALTFF